MSHKFRFAVLLVAVALVQLSSCGSLGISDQDAEETKLHHKGVSLFADAESRSKSRESFMQRIKNRKPSEPLPTMPSEPTKAPHVLDFFASKRFDRRRLDSTKSLKKPAQEAQQKHADQQQHEGQHQQSEAEKVEQPKQTETKTAKDATKRAGRFFKV